MSQYISPEQRAKIVSSIKDEGMSIADAAKTFLVAEKTVRTWLRKQTRNGHPSSTELQRLKQENEQLKILIGEMTHRHRFSKRGPLPSV